MHEFFLKRLTLLALITAIIALATFFTIHPLDTTPSIPLHEATGERIRQGTLPPPSLSTSTALKLQKSHGFQALVSYTDRGFEPQTVTIKTGQTVRFSNNSSHKLWVGATSTPSSASGQATHATYPAESTDLCGASSLDSCFPPFEPQDFWEVTLTKTGDWTYANLVQGNETGVVRVR